ncbi:MAG: RNA polymerase subunit sigma-24 [Bacteroidetes bacterium]|nr:MAG: RNA polymerase subunit sigma-24 [Bacteroidota bacterium]REJ99765.1 MAG: RNA polymerase subunit sigma-24 [Bacteroidota bacterium]REK34138.1 MAG: RNA polymerase subunit sigma-24 [Bacteroidota bacterium]REK50468.1 MAG: RNA polymerase subunit sigma-24 [Bacteroidota bacterium]
MDDKVLVGLYQKGDQSAISELIRRYKQRIYSSIFFLVRNRELAEDLFQETFIKIINSLRKNHYNEQGKFLPWALRIAHNLVIDHFRKQKLMPLQHDSEEFSVFDILPQKEKNPVERIIHDEKMELVRALLDKLPKDQREVVILRHYGGLSFKEISKMLDININTALGRMHYAILKMREVMDEKKIRLKE